MMTEAWKVVSVVNKQYYYSAIISSGVFRLEYSKFGPTYSRGDNLIFCFETRKMARKFVKEHPLKKLKVMKCIGEFSEKIVKCEYAYEVIHSISLNKESHYYEPPKGTLGFKWIRLLPNKT